MPNGPADSLSADAGPQLAVDVAETEPSVPLSATGSPKPPAHLRLLSIATIFLSSVLLFLIQPIIAKRLLPVFGGAAAVWATCLVFFQCVLLIGYLYAHLLMRRLRTWTRIAVHIVLLLLGAMVLFLPHVQAPIREITNPAYECLRTLARDIGLPYFVLSSTTPLVQAWYTRITRSGIPYRLFALSNFGSLLALLAYPFALERLLDVTAQLAVWRAAYLIFALLCGSLAIRTIDFRGDAKSDSIQRHSRDLNWGQGFTWIALSACSSALLLAVTNVLCQNIAPMPLLWVAPLAIYLITFVLCFDREGMFQRKAYRFLVPLALMGLVWTVGVGYQNVWAAVGMCLACLFILCMFCHGQLSLLKPPSQHLTAFYLCVSTGGAIGGIFVGLLAPVWFADFFELNIAIAVCVVLSLHFLFGYRSPVFLLACGLAIVFSHHALDRFDRDVATFRGRNFYGAISTWETPEGSAIRIRKLVHGRVVHGGQRFEAGKPLDEPTWYYGRESGAALAINRSARHRRLGVVGLGVGTLAAYGKAGDDYRFYEINPMVAEIARSKFTFLRDSKANAEIVLGDARMSLEREADAHFDTLVLDAFSGDSIPVHLLTYEAFQCYFRHMNPGGVIAVHVSNQYLDLRPVVANLAARFGRTAVLVHSAAKPDRSVSIAEWVLMTDDPVFIEQLQGLKSAERIRPTGQRLWTDQFSNVLDVLR
jgi:hypothetical protein